MTTSSVISESTLSYVRDATGNVLAVYEYTDDTLHWKEQHLYGSSRLGMVRPDVVVAPLPFQKDVPHFIRNKEQPYGARRYEMTNHISTVLTNPLGNVATVISDRKFPVDNGGDITYKAEILSASDYFPFGSMMTERTYSAGGYRYGFNTQEKVDEVKGTGNHYSAEFWEYDPRVVHRWNIDPRPNPNMSPYAILGGNPIFNTDHLGDTVRISGFSERTILRDLSKGLDIKQRDNPFHFDSDGRLQVDDTKYEGLDDNQRAIADNIIGTINSEITFTETKGASNQVIGIDHEGRDVTLWEMGGAATVGTSSDPLNVTIWMDRVRLRGIDRPQNREGNYLRTPNWLTTYHELGGHGFYRYVQRVPNQAGLTIDYENLVRSLHNLGKRDYDPAHPNPNQ